MRASLLLLSSLFLTTSSLHGAIAQQQPASIPTELAIALLERDQGFGIERAPKLVVGHAPAGISGGLTGADGAIVLGGMEYPNMAVVVLAYTLPPNQVMLAYDRLITSRGWAPPPPPADINRGGFVSSNYSYGGSGWGGAYCGDSGFVMVGYSPAPQGGTYLKVQQIRNREQSPCTPHPERYVLRGTLLKFPPLLPMSMMSSQGGGGSSGGDYAEISARLQGALAVADVTAHYSKQLAAYGWTVGTPLSTAEVAITPLATKDSTGVPWKGAISALRSTQSEVQVVIHMVRATER